MSQPLLAAGVLAACVAPATAAQTLLSEQARHVTHKSAPAPGTAAGTVFAGFDAVVADDAGRMLFLGQLSGGGVSSADNRAYFYGSDSQSLSLVLRSGDAEPSGTLPGVTLNNGSGSGLGTAPRIGPDGTMLLGCWLDDGGVSVDGSNNSALFHGAPGALQLLARKGDPAPGTAGATYSANFTAVPINDGRLGGNGTALFRSRLAGGDVTGGSDDEAWFIGSPGNVSIMLREGQAVSTGETIQRLNPTGITQINGSNLVLIDVDYSHSGVSPQVDGFNDRALLMWVPGGVVFQLLREGGSSPFGSARLGVQGGEAWNVRTSQNSLSGFGDALVWVGLDDGIGAQGLMVASLLSQVGVARDGDPAVGVPGAVYDTFESESLALTPGGHVVFQATLAQGGGVGNNNDSGLWTGKPGALELIAREGDVAPGTGGFRWGQLAGAGVASNASGQIIFRNTLTNPSNGAKHGSVWSYDPLDGLRLLLFNDGQPIPVGGGFVDAPKTAVWSAFNNGTSRPMGLQHDGTAELLVEYHSGVESVTKVRTDRLAASTDQISTAAGGTCEFHLSAGSKRAGHVYLLLGSASGTGPGTSVDGQTLPLNADGFLAFTLASANSGPLANSFGVLDDLGRATASLTVPAGSPSLSGLSLDFAYAAIDLAGGTAAVVATSQPVHLSLVP